jgi:hypothetical protein
MFHGFEGLQENSGSMKRPLKELEKIHKEEKKLESL